MMGVAILSDLARAVRSHKGSSDDGTSVLDAPMTTRAAKMPGTAQAVQPGSQSGTQAGVPRPALRRDLGDDLAVPRRRGTISAVQAASGYQPEEFAPRRAGGLSFRLQASLPRSVFGRVVLGLASLMALGGITAAAWETRSMLLKNRSLVVRSSSSIQVTGNQHLTRAQLVGIFGGDVDRNILTVPLEQRKAELERLPWVEQATVMRLLPNKFRVAIVERTPVAFVRQGTSIGLVDANGVLLDMASDGDAPIRNDYSFPVVTGLSQADPLSTRAARMQLYLRFVQELDANGASTSKNLSEVDLSNPEDVKALLPNGRSAILVHFGEEDFRHRYDLFEKNLPEWLTQHPKLAAVDMRYEHQVVLEMAPGAAALPAEPASDKAAEAKPPAARKLVPVGKPVFTPKVKPAAARAPTAPSSSGGHLQTSFDVKPKAVDTPAGRTQAVPQ